jgi:glycosyltransferase EpsE
MILFDENGEFGIDKGNRIPTKLGCVKGKTFRHATVMIRREAYQNVKGYIVDKRRLRVKDVDLWFKLFAAGYKGYNLEEPLYMMRDDRETVSRRKFKYRINSTYVRILECHDLQLPLYCYLNP